MNNSDSIKESLETIRKALEDDDSIVKNNSENILILNKLVNEDGTIKNIEKNELIREEVKEILDLKITELFNEHFSKWLDKNIPSYIDQYFKKKDN